MADASYQTVPDTAQAASDAASNEGSHPPESYPDSHGRKRRNGKSSVSAMSRSGLVRRNLQGIDTVTLPSVRRNGRRGRRPKRYLDPDGSLLDAGKSRQSSDPVNVLPS